MGYVSASPKAISYDRNANSGWFSASNSGVAHYEYKDDVRKYLEEVNSNQQVCVFNSVACVDLTV